MSTSNSPESWVEVVEARIRSRLAGRPLVVVVSERPWCSAAAVVVGAAVVPEPSVVVDWAAVVE